MHMCRNAQKKIKTKVELVLCFINLCIKQTLNKYTDTVTVIKFMKKVKFKSYRKQLACKKNV